MTTTARKDRAPKQQAPKQQAPKQQAPKQQAPKRQAPKRQAPKRQAPKQQAPNGNKAMKARANGATKSDVPKIWSLLKKAHPDAHCELTHRGPFELLVATVLSAQSTDVAVNQVTPDLFKRWPTPRALAAAPPAEVEKVLGRLGMFRQKTKHIIGLSKGLIERHGGEVPANLEALVELPGVGRKTANVVLGVAFGKAEGVVVDTHVQRIAQRLGFSQNSKPEEVEQDLMALFPKKDWDLLSHTLIFHGRRVCAAAKPACAICTAHTLCPSAFKAETVGRKTARARALKRGQDARP